MIATSILLRDGEVEDYTKNIVLSEYHEYIDNLTKNSLVLLGGKAFRSVGPMGKKTLVLSNQNYVSNSDIQLVSSIEEAIDIYEKSDLHLFVLGGFFMFHSLMTLSDFVYITNIKDNSMKLSVSLSGYKPIISCNKQLNGKMCNLKILRNESIPQCTRSI